VAQRYWVETLGCPKNDVDSDKLVGTLVADGMVAAEDPADADLVEATADLMAKATRGSATSKALGKQTYYAQIDMAQGEAYDFASGVMSAGAVSPDGQEGIAAFVEKRRADYPPRV